MSDGTWRDERRLPLHELNRAVARSTTDGQVDDVTGEAAGEEHMFGHGPTPSLPGEIDQDRVPNATDPARRHRPSTTGRTGPH
ncbi:MAG: hypothetical protein DIU79_04630 [Actinobacteria bacterium]|nr:MAG: hypothetical protein DIU79_04630 [Actinomycetota bacterium]